MEKKTNEIVPDSQECALAVHLVVSVEGDDRYVVHMGQGGPRFAQVALPGGPEQSSRLGIWIENAARVELGLDVSFVVLLALEVSSASAAAYALVTVKEPATDVTAVRGIALTLDQLRDTQADPVVLTHCTSAAHRTQAERFAVTIGRRVQTRCSAPFNTCRRGTPSRTAPRAGRSTSTRESSGCCPRHKGCWRSCTRATGAR